MPSVTQTEVALRRLLEVTEERRQQNEMKATWWDQLIRQLEARGFVTDPKRPFQSPFRMLAEYDNLMGVDKPPAP